MRDGVIEYDDVWMAKDTARRSLEICSNSDTPADEKPTQARYPAHVITAIGGHFPTLLISSMLAEQAKPLRLSHNLS